MSSITLGIKEIPVIGQYDAVIVGGGTAGAVAAISCARENLSTLVVEQFGAMGGSQTLALVTPIMPNGIKDNPVTSAISEEICDRMIKYGFGVDSAQKQYPRWYRGWFDPLILKVVLEEMVVESGCEIFYHTTLIDAIKENNVIQYAVIHNKGGLAAVKAKCFIDCTGDADVAYLAGVPVQSGNSKGINQAVSLRFQMTNIDLERFGSYLESLGQKMETSYPFFHTAGAKGYNRLTLTRLLEEKYREGALTEKDIKYFQVFSVPGKPKDLAFNCPELGGRANVIDSRNLSEKQIEGKSAIMRLSRFLKENVPGFEEAYICSIASMIGIRESRRIIAEYQLKIEDVLSYAKFPDGIAVSNYPVDVHGAGEGIKYEYKDVEESERYYEVPYRSLVAVGVDNLLVAGRCIGADFVAQSSVRVQHTCRATGEAAGIAAALALQNEISCREVDGKKVREKMRARGAAI